jgi:hypothetical protein
LVHLVPNVKEKDCPPTELTPSMRKNWAVDVDELLRRVPEERLTMNREDDAEINLLEERNRALEATTARSLFFSMRV